MNEGMDLKEFVQSVMRDVHEGLVAHLKERPNGFGYPYDEKVHDEVVSRLGSVDFDVAVTSTSESGKSTSGQIKVVSFFKGEKGPTEDTRRELVSRIRFRIHGVGKA